MNIISPDAIESEIRKTELGSQTFFDDNDFPWVREVEAAWPAIRTELDRLLKAIDFLPGFEEVQSNQIALTQDTRWKVLPHYAYGHWFEANVRRCPETVRALGRIPGLQASMFSILQPGKELPVHRGPYAGVLRYHLGLKVPKPETLCGIRVGADSRHWKEGSSLIFDDSHLHTAWNRSNEERVVLFVDFTRPLPSPISDLNNAALALFGQSKFIEDGLSGWEKWEKAYGNDFDKLLRL